MGRGAGINRSRFFNFFFLSTFRLVKKIKNRFRTARRCTGQTIFTIREDLTFRNRFVPLWPLGFRDEIFFVFDRGYGRWATRPKCAFVQVSGAGPLILNVPPKRPLHHARANHVRLIIDSITFNNRPRVREKYSDYIYTIIFIKTLSPASSFSLPIYTRNNDHYPERNEKTVNRFWRRSQSCDGGRRSPMANNNI